MTTKTKPEPTQNGRTPAKSQTLDLDWLKARRDEWQAKRDEFVIQANSEIGRFNGRIMQLDELITSLENEGQDD